MGKHLNPLEKEVLIKRFQANPDVKLSDFCRANGISDAAFRNWIKKYSEGGIEALISKEKGAEVLEVLPEGIEPTEENLKREVMKLRIENERLKKNYTVETTETGDLAYRRLKRKNSE